MTARRPRRPRALPRGFRPLIGPSLICWSSTADVPLDGSPGRPRVCPNPLLMGHPLWCEVDTWDDGAQTMTALVSGDKVLPREEANEGYSLWIAASALDPRCTRLAKPFGFRRWCLSSRGQVAS